MNPLRSLCLVACLLVATVCATPSHHKKQGASPQAINENSLSYSLRPSDWLSLSQLESMPSVDQVSWAQLEEMSNNEGATLVNQLYHLSQINHELRPNFRPSANDIPAYVMQRNGEKKSTTLNQLAATAKQEPNFGNEEVTIFITGLPQSSKAASKATHKLVEAYQKRYNAQNQQQQRRHQYQQRQQSQKQQRGQAQNDYDSASYEDYNDDGKKNTNNDYNDNQNQQNQNNNNNGNLVVIDLGATLTSFKRLAMLDVEQTANVIAKALVQLSNQCNVPNEIIHVIGQGIGAHVAGAAGREYTRHTGQKLRRITGLDPSKIYAKNPNTLTGLARGDAEFVDAIHTSAYGLGTQNRVGDVDFYPNGPGVAVPGTDNIVEASMRATRYYAESVVPGMEHNFPAVPACNLDEYKNNDGHGQRAYMGIKTNFDVEGDYILQVNAAAPFGKSSPAQKQINYHGVHPINNMNSHSNSNGNA